MVDILSQVLAAASTGLQQSNIVTVNKNRIGAAVHDGYSIKDFLDQNRMAFFIASVLGLVASGYGLKKRGGGEAKLLYSVTAVASLAAMWSFRPGATLNAIQPGGGNGWDSSAILSYLDKRASILGQEDPNFASRALSRLLSDTGGGSIPALNAFISA